LIAAVLTVRLPVAPDVDVDGGADVLVWLVVFELDPQAAARRAADMRIAVTRVFRTRTPSESLKADPFYWCVERNYSERRERALGLT
jgi:hypothetical protein